MYQDWSSWPACSAVPVLPYTGCCAWFQPAHTSAEVPPGSLAASWMPSITRLRSSSLRCTWRVGEVQRLHQAAVGFVDLLAQVRRHDRAFAAVHVGVGERRVGDRHLQRVGQQVALADRQVHVVADAPGPAFADDVARLAVVCAFAFGFERVLFGAPLARRAPRRGTRSAGRSRSARPTPSSWAMFWITFAVAVGELADFEEVGVGGDLQRFHQPDRAVVGVAGVAELLGRDVDALTGAETFARA